MVKNSARAGMNLIFIIPKLILASKLVRKRGKVACLSFKLMETFLQYAKLNASLSLIEETFYKFIINLYKPTMHKFSIIPIVILFLSCSTGQTDNTERKPKATILTYPVQPLL